MFGFRVEFSLGLLFDELFVPVEFLLCCSSLEIVELTSLFEEDDDKEDVVKLDELSDLFGDGELDDSNAVSCLLAVVLDGWLLFISMLELL